MPPEPDWLEEARRLAAIYARDRKRDCRTCGAMFQPYAGSPVALSCAECCRALRTLRLKQAAEQEAARADA